MSTKTIITSCVMILNYKCDYVGIEYAKANGFYMLADKLHVTYEGGSTGKSHDDFKPLLLPLSELTETVTINGKSFIPINALKGLYGWDYLWDDVHIGKQPFNVFALRYASVIKLIEWHFDVFNLIPTGLALNKLQNG